jgi:hypothetical protein
LIGAADTPTVNDTSAGNRIPEAYTGLPGVTLVPDTHAIWAGKLISKKHEEHYSDMRFRSVHHLATFGQGSSERFMYLSSGGTRTNLMTDAQLALELVSKSEGLNIAAADGTPILQEVGSTQVIGDGNDATFEYLPVFWVDAAAAPGAYHAEFRLVDLNVAGGRTPIPSSGRFFLDYSVPESAWRTRREVDRKRKNDESAVVEQDNRLLDRVVLHGQSVAMGTHSCPGGLPAPPRLGEARAVPGGGLELRVESDPVGFYTLWSSTDFGQWTRVTNGITPTGSGTVELSTESLSGAQPSGSLIFRATVE